LFWIPFGSNPKHIGSENQTERENPWFSLQEKKMANSKKTVVAFYYDWYGNPEISGSWAHWNECHYTTRDPSNVDERGYADLGATHNPTLGAYDSLDSKVVESHIELAEDIGLDAFAVTWWGQNDQRFEKILNRADSSTVKIALYWETLTQPEGGIDAAIDDLMWVVDNYTNKPGYWKIDGRPVIYVYRRTLKQIPYWSDWQQVLNHARNKFDVFFIADISAIESMQIFDGYHITTSVLQVLIDDDVKTFHQAMQNTCAAFGKLYAAPVIPGFDNSRVHEKGRLVADRKNGKLYNEQWQAAISCQPAQIMINSFNEWHEGSEIEPSLELGDEYLKVTKNWIEKYKSAGANA